ncbi:MAG TPA: TOBE domain-containing protein [Candidatus Cybelea sp.]|jgi:molybdopterin-binding protein|nr:TOBE domain-containing protein [Candidatus Cybelea sp.]
MELSARNQVRGRIKDLSTGTVMCEVRVETDPATITAAITALSAERLGLKKGDEVTVIVKSTDVIIGK